MEACPECGIALEREAVQPYAVSMVCDSCASIFPAGALGEPDNVRVFEDEKDLEITLPWEMTGQEQIGAAAMALVTMFLCLVPVMFDVWADPVLLGTMVVFGALALASDLVLMAYFVASTRVVVDADAIHSSTQPYGLARVRIPLADTVAIRVERRTQMAARKAGPPVEVSPVYDVIAIGKDGGTKLIARGLHPDAKALWVCQKLEGRLGA